MITKKRLKNIKENVYMGSEIAKFIGIFKVEELFEALQNLKVRDYLKLYQMMYQDLIEHQQLNYYYFENIDKENK